MLKFVTCDDNTEALNKTVNAINKIMMPFDFEYKIQKFTQYNDSLKEIINSNNEQKVYILDVELPKISGLEIASEIRDSGDWESMIIFVSAHPECRDDIFFSRIMALDFISKFFNYDKRLEESLSKVLEIYGKKTTLTFTYDYTTYRIPVNKILYIEKVTNERKCIIVTESGKKYEVTATLKELENKLTNKFYKCHKACIVNTEKIYQVDYITNKILFTNNTESSLLSNRCKKGLRQYVSDIY